MTRNRPTTGQRGRLHLNRGNTKPFNFWLEYVALTRLVMVQADPILHRLTSTHNRHDRRLMIPTITHRALEHRSHQRIRTKRHATPPLQHRSQRRSTTSILMNLLGNLLRRMRPHITMNMHTSTSALTQERRLNITRRTRQNRLIPASVIQHHRKTRWQIPAPITEQRLNQTTIRIPATLTMMHPSRHRRTIPSPNIIQTPLSLTSSSTFDRTVNGRHLQEIGS